MLRAGLASAAWITVDDTGARHKAANGFLHAGRQRTPSPGSAPLDRRAAAISSNCCAPATAITSSMPKRWPICANAPSPDRLIFQLGRTSGPRLRRSGRLDRASSTGSASRLSKSTRPGAPVATEGALWGQHRWRMAFFADTVIVSDDAGQFNVGQHGLCWVPLCRAPRSQARHLHRRAARRASARFRRADPGGSTAISKPIVSIRPGTARSRPTGAVRPPHLHTRKTGFVTLDRLLARLLANKGELLMVLDRLEIPLHTNGSENDI